jgi:hypothetical protein
VELAALSVMLGNIETARPLEHLMVDDIANILPEIDQRTAELAHRGQWIVPGYYEKFGGIGVWGLTFAYRIQGWVLEGFSIWNTIWGYTLNLSSFAKQSITGSFSIALAIDSFSNNLLKFSILATLTSHPITGSFSIALAIDSFSNNLLKFSILAIYLP